MEIGDSIHIADLSPEEAVLLFGQPVYLAWLQSTKAAPDNYRYKIVKIDRKNKSVTLELLEEDTSHE